MVSRLRIFLVVAVLLAAGLAAYLLRNGSAASPTPSVPVAPSAPLGVGALGRVEPAGRVRRLNQPGGMAVTRLSRLLVEEGQVVAAGALLAEFADAEQKDAAVAGARAALAEAVAQRDRVRAGGRPSEVAAQRARIASLGAQQEIAARDAERAERLGRSGAGAQAQAERERFAAIRAAADRAQAEAELETILRPRPEDLALAEARVAGAQASLAKAEADAALSRIYAPITGTVLRVFVRPGDQVGGDGVLELADLDRLEIVADVYETDLPRVREGAVADIVVPGEPTRFAATVTTLGWTVRRSTQANSDPVAALDARTVEVRLALDPAAVPVLRRRVNMQVQVAIKP